MIRRNAVTIAAGATFNLDFATEGFAPETRTVTFEGAASTDTTSVLVIFRNAGGSPFSTGSFPSGTYLAIPAAELARRRLSQRGCRGQRRVLGHDPARAPDLHGRHEFHRAAAGAPSRYRWGRG